MNDELLNKWQATGIVLLILAFCWSAAEMILRHDHPERYNKHGKLIRCLEDVEVHVLEATVIRVIHQVADTTYLVKEGDQVGGAIMGGGTAALMGFGPVGIIIGAALGADAESYQKQDIIIKPGELLITAEAKQDTYVFKMKRGSSLEKKGRFARSDTPSIAQLYTALEIGTNIRIPFHSPPGKLERVPLGCVYFPGEKIPYVDYIPG
jgi:hypothetical protein